MSISCTRCGCQSFHYNRRLASMECDSCGAKLHDPQQDQQLMQYDRTYAQAESHLLVGNWDQALSLLRPLTNQYPTDQRLYLGILRAATHNYQDVTLENASNKAIASDAWDKLVRLNCITAARVVYSKRRHNIKMREIKNKRNRLLWLIFLSVFCLIAAGICYETCQNTFMAILICCTVGCLYKAIKSHPVLTFRMLTNAPADDRMNPF